MRRYWWKVAQATWCFLEIEVRGLLGVYLVHIPDRTNVEEAWEPNKMESDLQIQRPRFLWGRQRQRSCEVYIEQGSAGWLCGKRASMKYARALSALGVWLGCIGSTLDLQRGFRWKCSASEQSWSKYANWKGNPVADRPKRLWNYNIGKRRLHHNC